MLLYRLGYAGEAKGSTGAIPAKKYRERQGEQDTRNWWEKPLPGWPRKG